MAENNEFPQLNSSMDDNEMESSEDVVNMVDVLNDVDENNELEAELYEDINSDTCTYPLGYLPRQNLWLCLTCNDIENVSAGICAACIYSCHKGHEIIPINNKRQFRCDCGNSKFPSNPCKLFQGKSEINELNVYNHNFKNRFCLCRDYFITDISPPMCQCSICEDWFHYIHIPDGKPTEDQDYICPLCSVKLPFLQYYAREEINKNLPCYISKCKPVANLKSLFPPKNWKSTLCKCLNCYEMYIAKDVPFLIDEQDDPEKSDDDDKTEQENVIEKILSKLNQTEKKQVDLVNQYYCDMASELKMFLAHFYQSGRVVTKRDIEEFFEDLSERTKNNLKA